MATEREFFLALREHFPSGEYALLPQVRNATGIAQRTRTADAIAVSLWPSRGIFAHGFEFKDSRTDFLKEMKDPSKAEEIGRYCAQWSIVVSRESIATEDEIPPAWGLMLLKDGVVKTIRKAPRREAQVPEWPFVGAILRAAQGVVTGEDEINRQVQEAVRKSNETHYRDCQKARDDGRKEVGRELEELRSTLHKFEQESGIRISRWQGGDIAKAVKLIVSLGDEIPHWAKLIAEKCDTVKKLADDIHAVRLGTPE